MEEFWRNLDTLLSSPVNTSTQTSFVITSKIAHGYGCKNFEMKCRNSDVNMTNQSQPENAKIDTDVKFLA